jgi:hypothetical protein
MKKLNYNDLTLYAKMGPHQKNNGFMEQIGPGAPEPTESFAKRVIDIVDDYMDSLIKLEQKKNDN